MNFSSKPLSQTITQLCLAKEIDHIVISPGSRSAPLTIGFTGNSEFSCYSIVDERSAAFFALGMAQQLRRPVALVCTSGSALLNYYPAVAEAYYSDIPLVILSADRPARLIDRGDGQTIRQSNVYRNHILYSADCKEDDTAQLENETLINAALNAAIEYRGPVHINLPFEEPLYAVQEDASVRPQQVPPRPVTGDPTIDYKALAQTWNQAKRKMLLVGVEQPDALEAEALNYLGQDKSLLVFTETTSNLHHSQFFPAIDQLIFSLEDADFERLRPELLITFGGMVVSKRIKAFLRKYPPKTHWHIDSKKAFDTYFALTDHFKTDPGKFFSNLIPLVRPAERGYRGYWDGIREHRLARHLEYLGDVPYSDFMVYGMLLGSLPKGVQLQLANSAAIRYAQLFSIDSSVAVYCNRGTSGIDGSTSTAIGAAVASQRPTVLITGDLSFFYDSNGLWNQYMPDNFRTVLINNGGGGIFRILPGAKETDGFETFFETRHGLNAQPLCALHGLEYRSAKDEEELKAALTDFYEPSGKARVLEVFTPSQHNDRVLMEYFEFTSH